jgi:hypothetical protein
MPNPVELRLATSNSFPTGTGSFSYQGEYQIVVENLAFQKQVAIHGSSGAGGPFVDRPAAFQESLPGGLELWKATTSDQLLEFAVEYGVNGSTFWDNNGGANYLQPPVFDEFDALLGNEPELVQGSAGFSDATHVRVDAAVKNLAFAKQVGMVFTTDGWATAQVANGAFDHVLKSGNEVWPIQAAVGAARRVEYALFYDVNGQQFWDNNFGRNYVLTR